MVLPQGRKSALPCFFRRAFDVAEIFSIRQRSGMALQSASDDFLPRAEVKHQFPNAMSVADRAGCGPARIYAVEDFHEGRAMPRLAVERPLEFIDDRREFRHKN